MSDRGFLEMYAQDASIVLSAFESGDPELREATLTLVRHLFDEGEEINVDSIAARIVSAQRHKRRR